MDVIAASEPGGDDPGGGGRRRADEADRIRGAIVEALESRGIRIAPDALNPLYDFATTAIDHLEAEGYAVQEIEARAIGSADDFAGSIEDQLARRGVDVLDAALLVDIRGTICPLWPFC